MKSAKFKATGALGKEMAAAKAAANRWYLLKGAVKWDPQPGHSGMTFSPAAKKAWEKYKDLVLYAAALGIKQGKLPEDLSQWVGQATWAGDTGSVKFRKGNALEAVQIKVRFLEWSPTAPVTEYPPLKIAA